MKKDNIAIIGLGYWGTIVTNTIVSMNIFKKIYIYDNDIEKINILKKKFKNKIIVSNFDSIKNNKKINNIFLATPPKNNFNILKILIRSRKNILIEKPGLTNLKNFRLVKQEFASGKVYKELIFDLKMGQAQKKFFTDCWELNKKKLINQGMILGNSAFIYRKPGSQKYISKDLLDSVEGYDPIRVDVDLVNLSDELDIDRLQMWQKQFDTAKFKMNNGVFKVGREVEKMSPYRHLPSPISATSTPSMTSAISASAAIAASMEAFGSFETIPNGASVREFQRRTITMMLSRMK